MRKIAIAMVALAALLVAANSYACGYHDGASAKASKAGYSSACNTGTGQSGMSSCQAGEHSTAMSGGTKIMTTEYRSDHQVLGAKGIMPSVAAVSPSPIRNEDVSSYYLNQKNYTILSGFLNLSAFYQP